VRAILVMLVASTTQPPKRAAHEPSCEILDHGPYVPISQRSRYADPASVTGSSFVIDEVRFPAQVSTIALDRDAHFGIRYRLRDLPKDRDAVVTWHVRFPKPGIRGSEGWTHELAVTPSARGDSVGLLLYDFDHDWEKVAGTWKFEVAVDGHAACSFDFQVR
jgi:uncharacterized protein DUF3859